MMSLILWVNLVGNPRFTVAVCAGMDCLLLKDLSVLIGIDFSIHKCIVNWVMMWLLIMWGFWKEMYHCHLCNELSSMVYGIVF
jgi:hypothetical protein